MEQKRHVKNLLEDGWFFGNSLLSSSKSSKTMVRCNSDPCPSSSTKENTLVSQDHPSKMSNLLRTPSLPVSLGKDRKYELLEEEQEDEEPSMGDLIRQAMPMPKPSRRLERTPSLPPCRGKEASSNTEQSFKKLSVDSPIVLPEKGPLAMTKLTRRASIDSSMLLPPRYSTKGTKQSVSNSKNRPQRKLEPSSINSPANTDTKNHNLDKSKTQKSICDQDFIEELQGFKDLGFSFEKKDVSSSASQVLPTLQRRASLDSNHELLSKVRRPYLSESRHRSSSPLSAPPIPKRGDQNASPSQDMKAQIKFWARAVASNVRQEC